MLLHTLFFSPPTMGKDPIGEIVLHIIWIEQLFFGPIPNLLQQMPHMCLFETSRPIKNQHNK